MVRQPVDVAIVGGGIAGFTACKILVENGRSVALLSGEDRLPYKRTKISKHIQSGFQRDQFALKRLDWYREHGVDLVIGDPVRSIDAHNRICTTQEGRDVPFENLFLAPGGAPRKLPGQGDSPREHIVHSAADAMRLVNLYDESSCVLVAGGGVLGVEVAEQLVKSGTRVSLAVAGAALLPKELDNHASSVLASCFDNAGVELRFNQRIQRIDSAGSKDVRVDFASEFRNYDGVVACIGIAPKTGVAMRSGIEVNHGILVNERLETSIPGIYAGGDAAEHVGGTITHLWHAAEEQGVRAAANILGSQTTGTLGRFRLKCEVFGRYFFSMRAPDLQEPSTTVVEKSESIYRSLTLVRNRLVGMVMIDDPERAKLYEQAVREGWSRQRISDELPISSRS